MYLPSELSCMYMRQEINRRNTYKKANPSGRGGNGSQSQSKISKVKDFCKKRGRKELVIQEQRNRRFGNERTINLKTKGIRKTLSGELN